MFNYHYETKFPVSKNSQIHTIKFSSSVLFSIKCSCIEIVLINNFYEKFHVKLFMTENLGVDCSVLESKLLFQNQFRV